LNRMGLAGFILPFTTHCPEFWVARLGRLADKLPVSQYGVHYATLVAAMRRAISPQVIQLIGCVAGITLGESEQIVTLADGETITARLVILANGLNLALRKSLGFECQTLSQHHSVTMGFDIAPARGGSFPFASLTYYGEKPQDRVAYLTLFRIGDTMRANLMTYLQVSDPRLKLFREDPHAALCGLLPKLADLIGPFEILGEVKVRPADLYQTTGLAQPGVVLVGDAFATSCPAAGTGTHKVLNDIERLCAVHVPQWLATPGMAAGKLASFYEDPQKRAVDRASIEEAYALKARSLADGPRGHLAAYLRLAARIAKGMARRSLTRLQNTGRRAALDRAGE
jgi:2-polyprenyl-6-methoxyphenol hydroxylase-like FAD-dependent oxidoreductase